MNAIKEAYQPSLSTTDTPEATESNKLLNQETLGCRFTSPSTQAILYLHPHIIQSYDPCKGRTLRADRTIKVGELVMCDIPFAVVPAVDPDNSCERIICSNLGCSRSITPNTADSIICKNGCSPDVRWCNEECRGEDEARHQFECTWLKKYGRRLQEINTHDYHLLWIIVRILAARYLELEGMTPINIQQQSMCPDRFISNWAGVEMLRSNREAWPGTQKQHWTELAETYLQDDDLLPAVLGLDETLNLICAVETNVFELCPAPTEIIPGVHREAGRGKQYGLALFLRITLANHSCNPNLTHQADDRGRMVVRALRDIAAGEECCTSYFDLMEYIDLEARRRQTRELFTFSCQCPRCLEEEVQSV